MTLKTADENAEFPDSTAAFQYACQSLDCAIEPYKPLPALVMNAAGMLGTPEDVKREPDGTQLAMLKVASADGGFYVLSKTTGPSGPQLVAGDFVAWMPAEFSEDLAASSDDARWGWVGMIFGTLGTRREAGSWVGRERFK